MEAFSPSFGPGYSGPGIWPWFPFPVRAFRPGHYAPAADSGGIGSRDAGPAGRWRKGSRRPAPPGALVRGHRLRGACGLPRRRARAADLLLIQAGLGLGGLEAFPYDPPGSGHPDQVLIAGSRRSAAQAAGQLGLAPAVTGERAAGASTPAGARLRPGHRPGRRRCCREWPGCWRRRRRSRCGAVLARPGTYDARRGLIRGYPRRGTPASSARAGIAGQAPSWRQDSVSVAACPPQQFDRAWDPISRPGPVDRRAGHGSRLPIRMRVRP